MQHSQHEQRLPREAWRVSGRRPRPKPTRPRPGAGRMQRLRELSLGSRETERLDAQQYLRLEFTVDDRR